MNKIIYEAYVDGTDIKAEFELPANAKIYEKQFEAKEAIIRKLDIRFRKKEERASKLTLNHKSVEK